MTNLMPRAECPRCKRPVDYCFCKHIKSETGALEIVILQHPKETRHPMNTAKIAELGLTNCTILTGEDFSNNSELHNLLSTKKCYLLFPKPGAIDSQNITAAERPEVVIILDGTWKKARKIYHCNPALRQLPAISIHHDQPSEYRIRKVPGDTALSTVEAAVILLRHTSNNNTSHKSLLDAFGRMIDLQINRMGSDTYEKNYAHRIRP